VENVRDSSAGTVSGLWIYAADWLHRHQHAEWATLHERVLRDVLERTARVTVDTAGRLIVFGASPPTIVADLDGDCRQDTIYVAPDDARALLTGAESISEAGDSSRSATRFFISWMPSDQTDRQSADHGNVLNMRRHDGSEHKTRRLSRLRSACRTEAQDRMRR
jgi:hypothetical protein